MAGAALAVFGQGVSFIAGRSAKNRRQRAEALRREIVKLENARTRREQTREFHIQRGQALAQSVTQGGGGGGFGGIVGSSFQGQATSLRTQLTANIKFLDESDRLGNQANAADLSAANALSTANTAIAAGKLFMSVTSLFPQSPSSSPGSTATGSGPTK